MKKWMAVSCLVPVVLTGCTNGTNTQQNITEENNIGGTLKVVTSRTDAEALFADIEEEFKALYPSVTDIIWESSADYDNYITTRMNTTDYGDVLLVPLAWREHQKCMQIILNHLEQ